MVFQGRIGAEAVEFAVPPTCVDDGLLEVAVTGPVEQVLIRDGGRFEGRLTVMRTPRIVAPADSAARTVTFELASDARRAVLTVTDRGAGVPEEALALLFEPFFRVKPDRGRSVGGLGLGLAIAERAVLLHGGPSPHGTSRARGFKCK